MPRPDIRTAAKTSRYGVASRLVPPLILAAILAWFDLVAVATLIVVGATLQLQLTTLRVECGHRILRLVVAVGTALSRALLFVVYAVVFAPVGIITGRSPRMAGAGRWMERGGPESSKRLFVREHRVLRHDPPQKRQVTLNLPTAVALWSVAGVAGFACVALAAFQISNHLSSSPEPGSFIGAYDISAYGDSPWAEQLLHEQLDTQLAFDALLGWRYVDFTGQYVNVVDGMRPTTFPSPSEDAVYIDRVHTNEAGAEIIAEQMWADLRLRFPELLAADVAGG